MLRTWCAPALLASLLVPLIVVGATEGPARCGEGTGAELSLVTLHVVPPIAGVEAAIRLTVKNSGGAAACDVAVRLRSDHELARSAVIDEIGPGRWATVEWPLTLSVPGRLHLEATVDAEHAYAEQDETDNVLQRTVEVHPPEVLPLVTSFGPETTARAGVALHFSADVVYEGPHARVNVTLGMKEVDRNDQKWDHEDVHLERGHPYRYNSEPYTFPLGRHCASFFAYAHDAIPDVSFDDLRPHTRCLDVSPKERPAATAPLADLVIHQAVPFQGLPPSGDGFAVTIANLGEADSVPTTLELRTDHGSERVAVPALAPGGEARVRVAMAYGVLDDPDANLTFVLDPYDEVWESDEDNFVTGVRASFGPAETPGVPVAALLAVIGMAAWATRGTRARRGPDG